MLSDKKVNQHNFKNQVNFRKKLVLNLMLRKNIFLEPLLTTVSISSVNVSLFKNPFPSPSQ